MFAANYDGLKKRETYDEIVEYLQYGQEKIKYPDRKAKQLRESPQLSNLLDGDGQGLMEMEDAQDRAMKNQQVEHLIREASKKNRVSAQLLRSNANQFMGPQHFDIASDYDESVYQTATDISDFSEEQKKDDDDKRGRGAGDGQVSLRETENPERKAFMNAANLRFAASSIVNVVDRARGVIDFGVDKYLDGLDAIRATRALTNYRGEAARGSQDPTDRELAVLDYRPSSEEEPYVGTMMVVPDASIVRRQLITTRPIMRPLTNMEAAEARAMSLVSIPASDSGSSRRRVRPLALRNAVLQSSSTRTFSHS